MLLSTLAECSRAVGETRSRLAKVALLADCLSRLEPGEAAAGASWLAGAPRQDRLNVGWALLRQALAGAPPAAEPSLALAEVDEALGRLAAVGGTGAAAERSRLLGSLLARATRGEQEFLSRLLVGELRQGALEGLLVEAVARAASIPAADVRAAAMLGGLPGVAAAVLSRGAAGLGRFRLRLLEPVRPMLAGSAAGVAEALEALGEAAFEHKLDGARVQVHKSGGEVRVFTRSLLDVTAAVPEVAGAAQALTAPSLILDGEALALEPGGRPRPFQETMRRFGRRLDVDRLRAELPLSVFFFDALHAGGQDLLSRPAAERFAALAAAVPAPLLVRRVVTADVAAAEAFLAEALRLGHEGVVAKSLTAPYAAGSRGGAWLKVKPARTLDLVVLAAEWGHGRRRGWLSNLHLGARDPEGGGFAMLGKTFKGLTDEMLAWQTERLRGLAVADDGQVVQVRPELVVEVAFDGVQASPRYPAGLALRFARVKGYRPDKRPD
ncbi:MAG TPA: ATP-dependent DNA ligase, partial [Anaeromyxobacteraceae bacterium]